MLLCQSRFHRSLRWMAVMKGNLKPPEESDSISSLFPKKSFSLPNTRFSAVEQYIQRTSHAISSLKPKPIRSSNLTPRQLAALRGLKTRTDLVIKPADKGGRIVVWSRSEYKKEALRQLHSTEHYTKLSCPTLVSDSKEIKKLLILQLSLIPYPNLQNY